MDANPPQGQESLECKNKMLNSLGDPAPASFHGKKMEHIPPSASPPEPPDERQSPTWGSNLMVNNISEGNNTSYSDIIDNLGLGESLNNVEQFVDEFEKGVVIKTIPTENPIEIGESSSKISSDEDVDNEYIDVDELRRSEKIQEDSEVVDYFTEQLDEDKIKQEVRKVALEFQISSPAQAGIPLTTPQASPVPKRPKKNVKFDSEDSSTYFETIDEFDEQIYAIEDTDEKYREWEMRLKRLQSVFEEKLREIEKKKAKSECSRE